MKKILSICEFGACPDGRTLNTTAIQKAIDTCHNGGGGQVVCPAGRYVTGSLLLKNHVELHLDMGCQLIGSENLKDYVEMQAKGFIAQYAAEGCAHSLIRAVEAEDIAVTGFGEINGSGLAFYDTTRTQGKLDKPVTARPRIVMFYRCRRVRFEDVSLIDSPNWTMWLMQCEDVKIDAIRIQGNRRMRNNDGIDIDACRDVTVSNCILKTEDDSLVIRAIQTVYETPAICENITINNCILDSSCQGVRVGCPSDGIIRNCVFTNLTINSSGNGIVFDNPRRYLSAESNGSVDIHHIVFSNVIINCNGVPIKIFVDEGIKLKRMTDINFSNFQIQSGGPCMVIGNSETIIRDVTFNNGTVHTTGETAIVCRHCQSVHYADVELSNDPTTSM